MLGTLLDFFITELKPTDSTVESGLVFFLALSVADGTLVFEAGVVEGAGLFEGFSNQAEFKH